MAKRWRARARAGFIASARTTKRRGGARLLQSGRQVTPSAAAVAVVAAVAAVAAKAVVAAAAAAAEAAGGAASATAHARQTAHSTCAMQSTKPRVAVLEVAAATVEGAMAAEVELLAEAGAAGGAAAQMPEVHDVHGG